MERAKLVQWKDEGKSGPVWVDGKRQPDWVTRQQARAIAKQLNAEFVES